MKSFTKLLLSFTIAVLMAFAYGASAKAQTYRGTSGDIVKLTGDVYVQEGTEVNGDVVSLAGDIYVNGTVDGNAVTVFGDVIVNGKVMGDATTVFGKITTGESGKILGSTIEALGGSLGTGNGIGENSSSFLNSFRWLSFGAFANTIASFIGYIVLFIMASLVYLIMQKHIDNMAVSMETNIGRKVGIGFLGIIGTPIAMVILTIVLAITIIGIIVIPFAWIAYLLAGFIALVPAYVFIGKKGASIVGIRSITGYGAMAFGTFILWAVKAVTSLGGIFTSWAGSIISLFIFLLGTGTLIDYIMINWKVKKAKSNNIPQGGEAGTNQ